MRHRALLVSSFLACSTLVAAADWPQWRGPSRDGMVPKGSAPAAWPSGWSRVWRVDVGEGYASPVSIAGRVFVHARRDADEHVTALDASTGQLLWDAAYPAPFNKNPYAKGMAKGPHSTPLVASGRVFTLGGTGILSAWNAADGRLVWRQDYSSAVDTSKLFCGTAMSPLLEGGSLIVQVGSDVHGGRVLALDPATGAARWTWKGPGPGYASPSVFSHEGVRQIATLTNSTIVGLDASTGAELWTVPFPDEWHENIVSPIWTGRHLVVSGTRQGTHAYTLARSGGSWQALQAWKNPDVAFYMSTPVLAGGIVYGQSNRRKGQFVALDAASGRVRWATEGRDADHASVVATDAHLIFLTSGASLIVARRSPEGFTEERRYTVADSATWALPVLLPDGLIIRDATGVFRLRGRE
jgi:outer membrane protein assembly factor BamB